MHAYTTKQSYKTSYTIPTHTPHIHTPITQIHILYTHTYILPHTYRHWYMQYMYNTYLISTHYILVYMHTHIYCMHSSYHICIPHMYITHIHHKETYIYRITYIQTDIQYNGTHHMPPARDTEYIPYICKHHRYLIHIHTILKHIVFDKSSRTSHPFQSFVCVFVWCVQMHLYIHMHGDSFMCRCKCMCMCGMKMCVHIYMYADTGVYAGIQEYVCMCVCL